MNRGNMDLNDKSDVENATALIDRNTIVNIPADIAKSVEFQGVYIDIDTSSDNIYVLLEAYTNDRRIAYTTLPISDNVFNISDTNLNIDVLSVIQDKLALSNGIYDLRVCVYENIIYSNVDSTDVGELQVEQISPTRYEIRTKSTLPKYYSAFESIENISRQGDVPGTIAPLILKSVVDNVTIVSTNWQLIEYQDNNRQTSFQLIFRSIEPIPTDIQTASKLQVIRELITPYTIPLVVEFEATSISDATLLRGPNFKSIDILHKPARSTVQETWSSLLGSNTQTSQQIVNQFLSGSSGAELNEDFRDYSNFIHFSSAAERLKNFKYKVELIEHYVSQSNFVSTQWAGTGQSQATGSSEFLANKAAYDTKRENIISGFDSYEKYLYFESHSTEITTYGTYPAATWPKSTSVKPYSLIHTTGSEAVSWYNAQLTAATLYDDTNINMLRNTIPTHIAEDANSNSYVLFVDMIGQHFDVMYNYISNITTQNDSNESLFSGVSKDLVYDVAKSFGWNLESGFDTSKLWEYTLGTNEQGVYNSGNTYVREQSYSHGDIEKQVWKRILNNIPYLLKTKGTSRGIKALLSTYGIPSTILQVQEYGGPVLDDVLDMRREIEKFSYAPLFDDEAYIKTQHRPIDYDKATLSLTAPGSSNRYPSMYELRFDVNHKEDMHLVSCMANNGDGSPKWQLYLQHSSSAAADSMYYNYGRLVFKVTHDASNETELQSEYLPFYDNDWWNVSFGATDHPNAANVPNTFKLRYAKIADHSDEITFSGSQTGAANSNVMGQWRSAQTVRWGGKYNNSSGIEAFSGSMQEIRMWAEHISDSAFHQHTLAATSILGDSTEMAYNDLLMRIPLGTNGITYNHSTATTTPNRVPNLSNNTPFVGDTNTTTPVYVNWDDANKYQGKSEVYYVNVPNPVGSRPHDKKIRIEDNALTGNLLSHDQSYETSSYNANAIDNDEISIALSPQDQIEIDIALQFGGLRLDDYIGDPRDQYSAEYKSLTNIRNLYFKKFDDKYNIWAFIRLLSFFNTGLFKQIETLLPARANATVGLVIRPNILERSKVGTRASMSFSNIIYNTSLSATPTLNQSSVYSNSGLIKVGERPGNPGFNRFDQGMEYMYGDYTESGVFTPTLSTGSNPVYTDSTAFRNLLYDGCKISSADFNEPSPQTIDGNPVVEYILTNPNVLITTDTIPVRGSIGTLAPNTDLRTL